MNVKVLRQILEDLPDEMEVFVNHYNPIDLIQFKETKVPAQICTINRQENFISIEHVDMPEK